MSWLTTSTTDWTQVLAFLLDCALKGSIVIAIAAGAAWMLRRQPAATRHTVWSAAIAAQLVIPLLASSLPTWRVPVLDEPAWVTPTATTNVTAPQSEVTTSPPTTRISGEQTTGGRVESSAPSATPSTSLTPSPRWRPSPVMVLTALWVLGCIAVLARLAAGTAVVSRMAVRGERVTDEKWLGLMHRLAVGLGIRRPLTLLRGDSLGVPVTWGIVYPVVLLPEDSESWPEERRRYVLVHEMAHVKRLDAFTQLVSQFALAIFWFNPLVWVASRQMRRERENACDDYVLTHGTKPSEYASDLLELVRNIDTDGHRGAAPAFAALAMARRSEFEGRMLSILDPRIRRNGLSRKGVVMSLITAIIVTVPLAAFSPFSLQQVPVNEGLPDSFKVSINTPTPTTSVDSSKPEPSVTPKAAAQKTESSSSGSAVEVCDKVSNHIGTSTSIHDSDERPDDRTIRIVQRTRGRCIEAMLSGRIGFSADERDIATIGRGARARFRELLSGSDRELVITSDAGQPRREYLVNGRSAEFDADGRAWLASMIVTVLRESGYNAKERVARLDQQGGVNRVLTEIDSIASTGAKRTYYTSLLELRRSIPDAEMARLFTRIKRDLAASSGDLRSVLQRVAPRTVRQTESRAAFADAIASISSDGDKSSLLMELAMTADRELLLDIGKVALSIGSDGDKSNVLITAAARFLGNDRDPRLRESFFDVAESVGSDGDKSRVLISAAPYGHADEAVTEAAIRTTLGMGSDGDKANVLIYIASQKLLINSRIKDAYLNAARNIGSDGDRARVLRAALTGAPENQ